MRKPCTGDSCIYASERQQPIRNRRTWRHHAMRLCHPYLTQRGLHRPSKRPTGRMRATRIYPKMPSNLDEIWIGAPLDLRQKVQNLLFCGRLKYDPEIGFLNLDNAHTFNQLQHSLAGNVRMVGVREAEFEGPARGFVCSGVGPAFTDKSSDARCLLARI